MIKFWVKFDDKKVFKDAFLSDSKFLYDVDGQARGIIDDDGNYKLHKSVFLFEIKLC